MATGAALPRRGRRTLEHHDPSRSSGSGTSSFIGPASSLARTLGVPSVLFVPATLVWEREKWGTARPVGPTRSNEWVSSGRCGKPISSRVARSTAVVEEVTRMGVPEARTIITPTGVGPAPVRKRR